MPRTEITAVTVSTVWDDDSESHIEIERGSFEESGPYVAIRDDSNTIYIRPDEWGEIRNQMQSMFDSMVED